MSSPRWPALAMAFVAGAGCGDAAPEAPEARIVTWAPESLLPERDRENDVTLVVAYRDGDGDLGGGRVLVHDCRAGDVVDALPIPNLATPEAVAEGVAIEGVLEVVVADVGRLEADAEAPPACRLLGVGAPRAEALVLCVELEDVGGRRGRGDCTGEIRLRE